MKGWLVVDCEHADFFWRHEADSLIFLVDIFISFFLFFELGGFAIELGGCFILFCFFGEWSFFGVEAGSVGSHFL